MTQTKKRQRVLLVVGTRPEGIKMAPIYLALKDRADQFEPILCSTGQHTDMLQSVFDVFGLKADHDFQLLQESPDLVQLASRSLDRLGTLCKQIRPDWVLCQGDTTSAFCAALAAFYLGIPVGHVEAGLRTYDPWQPYPEESNRRMITPLASLHFAPTEAARENLLKESIPDHMIHVTGNTSIDAMHQVLASEIKTTELDRIRSWFAGEITDRRLILVTGHRRENWGAGLENLCLAIRWTVESVDDAAVAYAVHLNPRVQKMVHQTLGGHRQVHLLPPLDYASFVWLMNRATIVLTDSGGIQEEAPGLGKPVLVARNVTERPEGVAAGTARLVGTDVKIMASAMIELLTNRQAYEQMARAVNPYGDGTAAARIADILRDGQGSTANGD